MPTLWILGMGRLVLSRLREKAMTNPDLSALDTTLARSQPARQSLRDHVQYWLDHMTGLARPDRVKVGALEHVIELLDIVEAALAADKRCDKSWTGIVRHYRTPGSHHHPYRGILKADDDVGQVDQHSGHFALSLQSMLEGIPDGHAVTITVADRGAAKSAAGFVYMLTKPNGYERVPIEQWKSTFPSTTGSGEAV